MKKIKIVTYCTWTSLGSILQALGLKRALSEVECQSVIWLNQKDNEFTKVRIHSVKSLVKRFFEIIIHKKRKAAYGKRMDFIRRNIAIDYFSTYEELENRFSNDDADIYLAGSDQIWHPDHCNPVFFLDFAKGKKRLSYAASMGKTQIRHENKAHFEQLIHNFDSISVREQECADVIQEMTERDVLVHIDPTFLVSSDEWRQYEEDYKVNKPYILLYMLYWDKSCKEKIMRLKQKTGLPVYAIANGLSGVYADKVFYDVGVGEFLWLVDHAECVITSSFHGVAFATIFNKKFAPVVNPSSPSRIMNLLRTLSLPTVDIEDLAETTAFNYTMVNDLITHEKERSIKYLKKVLD